MLYGCCSCVRGTEQHGLLGWPASQSGIVKLLKQAVGTDAAREK